MAQAIPIAMLVMAAAGTAVAVAGAQQQKKAAQDAGEYNKKVAEVNAKTAQQQAAFAAQQKRDNYLRVVSGQQASAGKAGITLDGSAEDVMYDTVMSGELDALTEEYKGKVGAGRYQQEGNLSLMESQSRANSASIQGYGSLLTGASRMATIAGNTNWSSGQSNPQMEGY